MPIYFSPWIEGHFCRYLAAYILACPFEIANFAPGFRDLYIIKEQLGKRYCHRRCKASL